MNALDRRDQGDVRTREARERSDLAGVVHADLGDAEPRRRRQPRQGQRHTPVVVVGRFGGQRRAGGGEDRAQHFFRCRLADAAGDGDQMAAKTGTRVTAEAGQPRQRIGDAQEVGRARHLGRIAVHQRAGRAGGQCFRDMIVPVAMFADQRHEQVAGA